jgi:hypothetical protein
MPGLARTPLQREDRRSRVGLARMGQAEAVAAPALLRKGRASVAAAAVKGRLFGYETSAAPNQPLQPTGGASRRSKVWRLSRPAGG